MIRIVCIENDFGAAANAGGPAEISHKTFDCECQKLEEWLKKAQDLTYCNRSIVGCEILEKDEQ